MKKVIACAALAMVMMMTSCGPKPYYKTIEGKKKQKHYNAIQFGGEH